MAKPQSRTREARQRRQKQRRQSRRMVVLIAIVMLAAVAIAVVIVSNQPVEAHIPDDLSARYQDIERSFSPVGYPRLGDNDAPVTIEEYASFACPGCEAIHSESFAAALERIRAGQVRFTYVPLSTGSAPNAEGASRAALCAGEQGMFWEMHDLLFDWQTRYGNTAFSQNRLLAGVEGLGLSSSGFIDCFNSAAISETLSAAQNEGVSSTPTIRVNGVTLDAAGAIPSTEAILQAIDNATPADWGMAVEEPPAEEPSPDAPESEPAEDVEESDAANQEPTEEPAVDTAEQAPDSEEDTEASEEETAESEG